MILATFQRDSKRLWPFSMRGPIAESSRPLCSQCEKASRYSFGRLSSAKANFVESRFDPGSTDSVVNRLLISEINDRTCDRRSLFPIANGNPARNARTICSLNSRISDMSRAARWNCVGDWFQVCWRGWNKSVVKRFATRLTFQILYVSRSILMQRKFDRFKSKRNYGLASIRRMGGNDKRRPMRRMVKIGILPPLFEWLTAIESIVDCAVCVPEMFLTQLDLQHAGSSLQNDQRN